MRMMHPALCVRRDLQRLQARTPLPPRSWTSPINTMRPPNTDINPQRLKQLHVDIDAIRLAADALVHNLDVLERLPVVGVVDVDVGAAEGVVVGVRGGEEEMGEGDDGLAGCGGDVAGGLCWGKTRGVDGHIPGVGRGEGDGDGERKGAEGEVAGFHICCWECIGEVYGSI